MGWLFRRTTHAPGNEGSTMALSDLEILCSPSSRPTQSRLPVAKEVSMLRRSTARSARLTRGLAGQRLR